MFQIKTSHKQLVTLIVGYFLLTTVLLLVVRTTF